MHAIFNTTFVLIFLSATATAQTARSIHELESKKPPMIKAPPMQNQAMPRRNSGTLTAHVIGYHPYWITNAAIDRYQFDLLSQVNYFSYEVEPATGKYTTIHDWLTTPLISKAKANGVRVHLSVTNFGTSANATLLSNPAARDTLIATLVRLVAQRNADGIDIDFESVPASQRQNLVSFFRDLRATLLTALPHAQISAATPAVDWSNAWDVAALQQYVDRFFVMCYDYFWSGSDRAGPVAPLTGANYNVTRTIDWYLSQGVAAKKIILGVPYYGYDWPVTSDTEQALTNGSATARTYSVAKIDAQSSGRRWSALFQSPWYSYQALSQWRQCWYDDSTSLRRKYEFARARNIGGVGMWALGYDGSNPELWDLLRSMFFQSTDVVEARTHAALFRLSNHPNPFSITTEIIIEGMEDENARASQPVALRVCDLFGRCVIDLSEPARLSHRVRIASHQLPAPGVYLTVLDLGGKRTVRRLLCSPSTLH